MPGQNSFEKHLSLTLLRWQVKGRYTIGYFRRLKLTDGNTGTSLLETLVSHETLDNDTKSVVIDFPGGSRFPRRIKEGLALCQKVKTENN